MLRSLALAAVLACTPVLAATTSSAAAQASQGVQQPVKSPVLGTDTVHGCYSSKGDLDDGRYVQYNSQGECNKICRDQLKKAVAASYATTCYCGDEYPPAQDVIAASNCNEPCPGFGQDACGGFNAFTVYNTGLLVSVGTSDPETSSSAVPSPSTTTSAAPAATSSATPSTTPTDQSQSSGPPTVAIAVSVVVGILAVAAVSGGVFFYMRRKRNTEIEEEHRRNAAVNAFISGGKPPGSSDGLSMSDSRLDPVIANRRMSDGSIADNQDYSRRILRVTNA